jgi:hypothetical protein
MNYEPSDTLLCWPAMVSIGFSLMFYAFRLYGAIAHFVTRRRTKQ